MTNDLVERCSKLPGLTRRQLSAGHTVRPRPRADLVHVVIERGHMALGIRRSRSGDLIVTEVMGPGSCLVPNDLPGGDDQLYELLALTPVSLLEAPLTQFDYYLASDASLAAAAQVAKVRQVENLRRRLCILGLEGASQRVAGALLFLAHAMGQACPLAEGVTLLLTQRVVAAVADVTRQTASAELARLHRARHIHQERGLVCVLSRESLRAVASGRQTLRPEKRSTSCRLRHPQAPLDCAPPRSPAQVPRR